MTLPNILTLLLGLATTVLGILLKAEYDKRIALQQQVEEKKREAYAKFNETINDFLTAANQKDSSKGMDIVAKQLIKMRQGIWQYGSGEVVKAYSIWSQCMFAAKTDDKLSAASLVLMADLIVKMRKDLGLSKPKPLNSLDILRVFTTDADSRYDELANDAKIWRDKFLARKHQILKT